MMTFEFLPSHYFRSVEGQTIEMSDHDDVVDVRAVA